MKKLKPIDVFGYNAEEFEAWWKESAEKMEKRAIRKFGFKGDMQTLPHQRKGSQTRPSRAPRYGNWE